MLLGKKKTDTQEERNNVLRQKIISFKKFFGTDEGREVMLDLINKFYILNPLPVEMSEFERGRPGAGRERSHVRVLPPLLPAPAGYAAGL